MATWVVYHVHRKHESALTKGYMSVGSVLKFLKRISTSKRTAIPTLAVFLQLIQKFADSLRHWQHNSSGTRKENLSRKL